MKITFINVGYGEAILIKLNKPEPVDQPYTVMIDGGGNDTDEFKGFTQRVRASDYLKEKGIKKIDLLISTHIHEDHTCGLWDIVKQVQIGEFWCNYEIPPEFEGAYIHTPQPATQSLSKFISAVNSYNQIYFALKGKGVPIRQIFGIKEEIILKNDLKLDVLGPSEEDYKLLQSRLDTMYSAPDPEKKALVIELDAWMNMPSIMLRFHYHGIKLFLPSDVNCMGYGHLKNHMDLVRADIFKAAHHGQIDGISDELAGFIRPRIVVTCASSDGRYNSSNRETYEIIERSVEPFGEKPLFLFSDNIEVKGYSESIATHQAVLIEIDDKSSKISCRYE